MKRPEWEYQPKLSEMSEEMLKDRLEWLKDRSRKLQNALIGLRMQIDETKDILDNRK